MSKIEDAVKLAKILSFLEKYEIKNATINDDFTVDVDDTVFLWRKGLTEIPIQFGKVTEGFDISENKLTSLEGCPKYVEGTFYCSDNNLKSLIGCPKEVGGNFYCENNQLITLEVAPEYVGGYFHCKNNPNLKSLKGLKNVKVKIHSDFFTGYLKDYNGEL